jgi:uncharacterized protein (TIGR02145 family)
MTTSRISAVAIALSIAFGFVSSGAGSTQGSAKDQKLSGTSASSKRMADGKAAYTALLSGGTSGFNTVLGGNRSGDGKYDRLEAHGIYWTVSENDPITAPFYNFGKGSQGLYRQPQGQKRMAVSVRCVRE